MYAKLRKGMKVVRGPTWTWGDQGHNTVGTVISDQSGGWICVRWENGQTFNYPYDGETRLDVIPFLKQKEIP